MKRLIVGAHPDDIEVMLGYGLVDSMTLVATDGEAGIDMTGTCSCPGGTGPLAAARITAKS